MSRIQPWLGWIAIGVGVLALVVALQGTSLGATRQGRFADTNRQQSSAVQGTAPQSSAGAPKSTMYGGRGQAGNAPQNNASAPNTQQQGGRFGADSPRGSANSGAPQRGPGRSNGGFSFGSWLRFPFRLLQGLNQLLLLGVVVVLGLWLLRGRRTPPTASSTGTQTPQASAQGSPSPTGEWYTDEPSDQA